MTKEIRPLFVCGDVHGEWKKLVWLALNKYKITGADIVVLGDFGVGFDKTLDNFYKHVHQKLEDADLILYTLRGNHDDPEYFKLDKYSYPRLKFLEDGKIYEFNGGRKTLIMGGANSTDITWRLQANQKFAAAGLDKRVWWPGEDITRIPLKELPVKVDIILSHEAPLIFEPVATRFDETPPEQYDKILAGRKYLDEVLQSVKCDYWYYGHYHNHYSGQYSQTMYRGLDILEFFEVPDKREII